LSWVGVALTAAGAASPGVPIDQPLAAQCPPSRGFPRCGVSKGGHERRRRAHEPRPGLGATL